MAKTNNNDKVKKGGRPKGAKSKLNIPARSIEEAVDWATKIYQNAKENEFHPDDLPNYLGIGRGFSSPALSILDKFGLIEKAPLGWRVSQLGKSAINKDKEAIKESLERIDLYRDLFRAFGERKVNKSIIVAHLKSKHKYGENTEVIADKFVEAKDYLDSLEEGLIEKSLDKPRIQNHSSGLEDENLVILLKLKYAFKPINDGSKEIILEEAYNKFKNDNDTTVASLIGEIKKNKTNKEIRQALINALISSFELKYPILKEDEKPKQEPQKKVEESSDKV